MFNQTQRPADGMGKQSAFYKGVSALGTAIGIGAAILATPPIFNATRGPLLSYLTETWGGKAAEFLTYVMGAVEAYVIYAVVKLLLASAMTFGTAALAARRFPGS